MTATRRARLARLVAGAAVVVASGGALTSCAASAGDLARAACVHVGTSLDLLTRADHASDPAEADKLRKQAYLALLPAIPIAAQAAYHDIAWESLSATLTEIDRVPETELVPALRAQCRNADRSVFDQPPPPSAPSGG